MNPVKVNVENIHFCLWAQSRHAHPSHRQYADTRQGFAGFGGQCNAEFAFVAIDAAVTADCDDTAV